MDSCKPIIFVAAIPYLSRITLVIIESMDGLYDEHTHGQDYLSPSLNTNQTRKCCQIERMVDTGMYMS